MLAFSHAADAIGGDQTLGGDHHRHLDQQRREGQEAGLVAGQQGGGDAEHRERQREIVPAKGVKDVDAPGEYRARFLCRSRVFPGH
jgi:hypothetical protein